MKTIIITGAAVAGYGQAITKLMLANKWHVIGTYLNEDESLAKEFQKEVGEENFSIFPLDLWSRESLDLFFKKS